MPKYNVALVLTRRNAYTEAIAESQANPGKPLMTGEEMNWRILRGEFDLRGPLTDLDWMIQSSSMSGRTECV